MHSFHHIFSVSKWKGDLSDKIFNENQLAIKTNQIMGSYQFFHLKYIFLLC